MTFVFLKRILKPSICSSILVSWSWFTFAYPTSSQASDSVIIEQKTMSIVVGPENKSWLRIWDPVTQKASRFPILNTEKNRSFFHWGEDRVMGWTEQGKINEEQLGQLRKSARENAIGGGLYVSDNPVDTEMFGQKLMVVEPNRSLQTLSSETWTKVAKNHLHITLDDSQKIAQFNESLSQLKIDAIQHQNGKWYNFLRSEVTQNVRGPTVNDLARFRQFSETAPIGDGINAFLKLSQSGQLDVFKLPPDRFPVFIKAIKGEKLTTIELNQMAKAFKSRPSMELVVHLFPKQHPFRKNLIQAFKKSDRMSAVAFDRVISDLEQGLCETLFLKRLFGHAF